MRAYQEYLEHLINTRINFFLIFFALVIGGTVSSGNLLHIRLLLSIGALLSIPLALAIFRAQKKMDLAFNEVRKKDDEPLRIIDDMVKKGFPPSMRKKLGYGLPLICVILLLAGAALAWFAPDVLALSSSSIDESSGAAADGSSSGPTSISSVITAAATLGGVLAGSLLTYLIQSTFHRRERNERRSERIRDAYATWAGSILQEVDACRRLLLFRESTQQISTVDMSEATILDMGKSMKEMSAAALDATHREQVAFARVQLTDLDLKRRNEAHEIRLPVKKSLTDPQADVSQSISTFTEVEQEFVDRLSKFLATIAKSLDS